MRFLMLNWRDPRNPLAGGAERVTLGYLAALVQRGHEVVWFSFHFDGASPEETIEGIRILRAGGIWAAILKAIRWSRRQPPFDLVIDQHHGIPWFAPWWCRTHCVAYVHEVLGPIWDAFYRPPWNWIGKRQERWMHWLYRNVPFWTASQATREDLLRHGVRQVTTIPYGVHTAPLEELETKELSFPLRLIVVSRLAPNKRIDHAIRALRCLKDRGWEAQLTVVGSGGLLTVLCELADSLGISGKVCFAGALAEEDKDRQLRNAHLLIHTSQREGWGLNVIEANAMGTPSIAYPVKGLTESTLHEQTGLVTEAETPESVADSIVRLIQAPGQYQRLRRKAWERAKTFHWSQVLPVACDWLETQARGGEVDSKRQSNPAASPSPTDAAPIL